MNRRQSYGKLAVLLITLIFVVSFLHAGIAYASSVSTAYDPQAPQEPVQALSNPYPYTGVETVLLIQDVVPWGLAGGSSYGAVVDELLAQNKPFCMITSSELNIVDLSPFNEIIIPSAQTQAFYDNLFPSGVIHPKISNFVYAGGILSANLADNAGGPGAGGDWDGDTFVAGVRKQIYYAEALSIADPSHPIVTDMLPCSDENVGPIVDESQYNDLDGWGFSSHGDFTSLPSNTKVILTNATGYPVFIEYRYGSGIVLATMCTLEWMYIGPYDPRPENRKLLANEICYQDRIVPKPPVGGTLIPTDKLRLLAPSMGLMLVAGAMIVLGSKRKERKS